MTGVYIHADGSGCDHGIDPDTLDAMDTDEDLTDADRELLPPRRPRCAGGRPLAGFRLDPDQPAPP